MKAVQINEFGGPEVLHIQEVERPVPASDEILVKCYASGVNPADWVVREGGNDFLRPLLKLPLILGWDAAGVVEEVGSQVTTFKKGDEVYGVPNFPGNGSYAEYFSAKANQFAIKPKSISFNEAAGVPLAGLVAWSALFDLGNLQAGQRVFIMGASGGVGSFAVQFAKAQGAYIIASASTGNLDFLKQLGADEVIDYMTQDFEKLLQDIDVVFNASAVHNDVERLKSISVLREGGIYVSAGINLPLSDAVKDALAKKKSRGELVGGRGRNLESLRDIAQLIDSGKVKVIISKVYLLEQVAEAHRLSQTWHVRGKIVLEIRK